MKEIKLTQDYVALVDDEDYERINQYKWFAHISRNVAVYAVRTINISKTKKISQKMHRFVLGITDSTTQVDHIDHNTLNNQKINLRKATFQQNSCNKKKPSTNLSGFKGVCWNPSANKWQASIKVNQKCIYLGIFADSLEAACAYDMAAVKHFGMFAHCNFAEAS
jgi:hypothetical protein